MYGELGSMLSGGTLRRPASLSPRFFRLVINASAVVFAFFAPNLGRAQNCKQNRSQCLSEWYQAERKWYVVVGSSKSSFGSLPSAESDARDVQRLLSQYGYAALALGSGLPSGELLGTDATYTNINKALSAIARLPGRAHLVVLYFSGHGTVNQRGSTRKDLWLQLNGTDYIPARTLVEAARWNPQTNASFVGRLVIVIDSCDSGQAIFDTDDETMNWTMVSSSADQNSHLYPPNTTPQSGLCTHLLVDGIANHWDKIDIAET